MTYLGLDLGSTSIKGAVLSPETGTISEIVKEPFPELVAGLPPLHFEVDPVAVLAAVRRVIGRLLPSAPDCRGIVLCGQMGGVILTDDQHRPLTNYLSWRDQRTSAPTDSQSEPLFSRLKRELAGEDFQTLGRELQTGATLSLLAWLEQEGCLPRTAVPMSLGDFVVSQLCRSSPVMEYTEATGLLDLRTRSWHHSVFARWELDRLSWPRLQTWREPAGMFRLGDRTVPVYPSAGDHQCALAGVGLEERELSINISTGSQVALLTPAWSPGDCQTRCYLDSRYLNTITYIPAGRSLNVLVDLLSELAAAEGVTLHQTWETIAQAAARAEETDLDINLSFFAGPLGDRGHLQGITTENLTLGTLFRAAFRQMADNYAILANRLSPTREWRSVILSGGLAQNISVLRQFLSERFPGPHRLCTGAEDTLFGLLTMARILAGQHPAAISSLPAGGTSDMIDPR